MNEPAIIALALRISSERATTQFFRYPQPASGMALNYLISQYTKAENRTQRDQLAALC
jgi:hypothetical protein